MQTPKPLMLIILDGWGINPKQTGNAVLLARTPNLDELQRRYPHTRLDCAGEAVGLPAGIMGNSEVGHLNIGAGRIVYQDLLRIDRALASGTFFENPALCSLMDLLAGTGGGLHLLGLVSDGGVHSQLTHLFALIEMARRKGLEKVFVHAILDGRDTPPESGAGYIRQLEAYLKKIQTGAVASICGRYYAMDRDNRWERIEKACRLYRRGEGHSEADPLAAVQHAYARGESDEFVQPISIVDAGQPATVLQDGDGVVFFNFRADRAREITRALTDPEFGEFPVESPLQLGGYVCMTSYDEKFDLPVAFPPVHLENILAEVLSRHHLRQLRIAETEKYAHVTYFFNGGEEKAFELEDRCLIPSPKEVATYDLKPEMSAYPVTEELLARLDTGNYDFIALNFANMDMVGHTGDLAAAIRACEVVDECVGKIVTQIRKMGGAALVTADHGNAEKMIDDENGRHTAHTTHPVPLILVDDRRRDGVQLRNGILADIAPTILKMLGIAQPPEMTGKCLFEG